MSLLLQVLRDKYPHNPTTMRIFRNVEPSTQLQLLVYTAKSQMNTDYLRQAQVLNIDNLKLLSYLWNINENIK